MLHDCEREKILDSPFLHTSRIHSAVQDNYFSMFLFFITTEITPTSWDDCIFSTEDLLMSHKNKSTVVKIIKNHLYCSACWLSVTLLWLTGTLKQVCLCGTHSSTHSFDDEWMLWFIVVNDDTDGTRHQSECKSSNDAEIWHSIFQTRKTLAVDIEQQRHHAEGSDVGASGHNNAGRVSNRVETLFKCLKHVKLELCFVQLLLTVYCKKLFWCCICSKLLRICVLQSI